MLDGKVVQFAPVNVGSLSEIPPDLPAGAWEATCTVKKLATAKDNYPMLALEWRTTEALTDGNEDAVGARATDFVVFFPANHKASRMSKIRLKTMCDALDIEVPSATKLTSWDDLSDFISALDGAKATIYTTIEVGKDGEQRTKVQYTQPGASLKAKAAAVVDDDDDEEEERPVKKLKKTKRAS